MARPIRSTRLRADPLVRDDAEQVQAVGVTGISRRGWPVGLLGFREAGRPDAG